jgi:hypothetical protein
MLEWRLRDQGLGCGGGCIGENYFVVGGEF